LLTDARRAARSTPQGFLIPLEQQDRSSWDKAAIAEGVALVSSALQRQSLGPYQVQAAIAALHDEARTAEETDWPQIAALYIVLERIHPSPVVTLNRAVAIANVRGSAAGLQVLGGLSDSDRASLRHRFDAVQAHLLERNGDLETARECYLRAAKATNNRAEQRYLIERAARL
jgi:predicted RNA polymerase sigma factor